MCRVVHRFYSLHIMIYFVPLVIRRGGYKQKNTNKVDTSRKIMNMKDTIRKNINKVDTRKQIMNMVDVLYYVSKQIMNMVDVLRKQTNHNIVNTNRKIMNMGMGNIL